MDTFMQTAGSDPQGMAGNRYFKTSEYQVVKVMRKIIMWFSIAFGAILRLSIDVLKGIVGKS